jgi:diguanylate cyclase (GGDEF)-like protein
VLALLGACVTFAALATGLGFAARIGSWLDGSPPLAANLVLVLSFGAPIVAATRALRRDRRGEAARRELARLSLHDPMTDLPNRLALPASLAKATLAAHRSTLRTAVLFCDLDRFKLVNDTYGHEFGDRLMGVVADRIRAVLNPGNVAVRYGGDEFVIIAASLPNGAEAERLAGRLVRALEEPFEISQGPGTVDTVRISVSIGIALSEGRETQGDDLVRNADVAMYQAKSTGPGAVCVFDPSMRTRLSRSTAQQRLRVAIERNQIGLRYEPILAVADGALVGLRAHLHWEDPERGAVPAAELLPALEETGLILPVGAKALEDACRHAKVWRDLNPGAPVQVTVPISARQLAQAGFRDLVAEVLSRSGAERSQLCLAVSEGSLADEITGAWTMLRHARVLGVHVTLDGFGAGTSSLADLRRARLDQLCIDRSLVAGLDQDSEDLTIVQNMITLAHQLGMITVADRVEHASQLARLRRLGCDRAMGPFFGMALAPEEVGLLVAQARRPAREEQHATPGINADEPVGLENTLRRLRTFESATADVTT